MVKLDGKLQFSKHTGGVVVNGCAAVTVTVTGLILIQIHVILIAVTYESLTSVLSNIQVVDLYI